MSCQSSTAYTAAVPPPAAISDLSASPVDLVTKVAGMVMLLQRGEEGERGGREGV